MFSKKRQRHMILSVTLILCVFMGYSTNQVRAGASSIYYHLEDPLFQNLLSNKPQTANYILYWGYNTNKKLFRSYALKFGHRWSLSEQCNELREYQFIPMYYPEKCLEYGVPFMLALDSGHPEAPLVISTGKKKWPWILDPRIEQRFLEDAQEKLSRWAGKGLWGLFIGDEIYSLATRVVPKHDRYKYIQEANKEIRRGYGFGKYGMPESNEDSNPFRWIAYRRWVADKLKKRYKNLYKQVKKEHRDVLIIGPDPQGSVPPDDYSGFAPFIDIMVGQAINDIRSPRLAHKLMVGYATKALVDLSGKPVYPAVQSVNFLGSPTPEHIRERFSQVFRNGGSGIFLLAVEWFDRELNHHKYSAPLRWQAILEVSKHITSMNNVKIPDDPDIAILYSSDSLSARPGNTLPENMLSAYSIVGPVLRSWFDFVDDRQIIRNIKKLEQYKILIVPYAKYERSSVVEKIQKFVERGGILISTDPEVFSFDINGDSLEHVRKSLFGIKRMRKKPSPKRVVIKNRNMPIHDRGFHVILDEKVEILGTFEDHSPALISKKVGKGETIWFAFNPFTIQAPEESSWINFWRTLFRQYGLKMERDIWRFKFPPFKTLKIDVPNGKCLTNNHALLEENVPNMEHNSDVKGSYSFSLPPDLISDVDMGKEIKEIPFSRGHLTNRLPAIRGRILGRWVRPADIKPWVVGWKTREPFSIIFDLARPHRINKAKIFWSGRMPEVIIGGSNNQIEWSALISSNSVPFTSDVLNKSYSLNGNWQYLKFFFGERLKGQINQENQLILSEIEIWGK